MNGMSGCDDLNHVKDVISYIAMNNTCNVPVTPDYSGKTVNNNYDAVQICYELMQQIQFLLQINN